MVEKLLFTIKTLVELLERQDLDHPDCVEDLITIKNQLLELYVNTDDDGSN